MSSLKIEYEYLVKMGAFRGMEERIYLFLGKLSELCMAIYRNIVRPIRQLSFESIIANEKFFNYAQDILCITQLEGIFRRVNPAFESILDYDVLEIVGKPMVELVHPSDRELIVDQLAALRKGKNANFEIRMKHRRKGYIWIEWNAFPDEETSLLFLIGRNVTERREYEEQLKAAENRTRQFLEHLPVAVFVVDSEGHAFYENKRSQEILGRAINPNIGLANLSQYYKVYVAGTQDFYPVKQLPIVRALTGESNEKGDLEIEKEGERSSVRMYGAPIYDLDNNIAFAISVIDDVTERSKKERIISQQNRFIVESLNYALKVQRALLPDSKQLKQVIPESFIFQRAKHIVSGDFPLIIQSEHDLFVGAVDCTGHGVPGALMSIAGFYMLNEIITKTGEKQPDVILQVLHATLIRSLNHNEQGYNIKDGLDIALCRINLTEGIIEYAGARNPLFVSYDDSFEMIHAEDFSIGEDIERHRNNRKPKFENHKLEYRPGMQLYMGSDGFKDQFGGKDKKKFGTKRLHNLIYSNRNLPVSEQESIYKRAFVDWLGDQDQIDDVLLIGFKL